MKYSSIALLMASGLLLVMTLRSASAKDDNKVEAAAFTLRSPSGQIVGAFDVDENGMPRIVMLDRDGQERATLRLRREGQAILAMNDKHGVARLVAGLMPNDLPYYALFDSRSRVRLQARLRREDERPYLYLWDENERTRAAVGAIDIEQHSGEPGDCPESSLVLFGPDGKLSWRAPR